MAESSESPTEVTALLQPGADETDTRRKSADSRGKRNACALPTAFLTALLLGLNEGYSLNVNTTYIGKDMNDMQKGVLVILLPIVFSAIVPPVVPLLRTYSSRRFSMLTAAAALALGLFGSAFPVRWCSLWPIALSQSVSGFGAGLLNLLTYLAIREATEGSRDYSKYRALYMGVMKFGMLAGALGGAALIECVERTRFAKQFRPWQLPFLMEFFLALLLLGVIYWTASPRQEDKSASRPVASGILETAFVILCTITPTVLCCILIQWGVRVEYFLIASAAEAFFIWVIYRVRRQRETTPLYSAKVAGSKQVLLLVLARATMSATVKTLLYRLPLYSQIRMMIEAGPDKQDARPVVESLRQACSFTVESAYFKQMMVPASYVGEFVGEFVAVAAIGRWGHESNPLVMSLLIYFMFGQLFGNGAIGRFSAATLGQTITSMPMMVTVLAGIANGSADNCLSSFLFTAVDDDDRPAAEALSSLASNIFVAAALTFAPLRYESLLRNGLIRNYGEEGGLQLVEIVLHNISAADSFSSGQRSVTLQYAQNGIEKNIWEVDLGLVAGVIAARVLHGMVTAG